MKIFEPPNLFTFCLIWCLGRIRKYMYIWRLVQKPSIINILEVNSVTTQKPFSPWEIELKPHEPPQVTEVATFGNQQSLISSTSESDHNFESITLPDNIVQAESSSLSISSFPIVLDDKKTAAASASFAAPPVAAVVSSQSAPSSSSAISKIFSFRLFNFVINVHQLQVVPIQNFNIFNIFGK